MLIEVLSDSISRSHQDIKRVLNKNGSGPPFYNYLTDKSCLSYSGRACGIPNIWHLDNGKTNTTSCAQILLTVLKGIRGHVHQ